MRQNALRLAIVSALGACAWGAADNAQADSYACKGAPTQNLPQGVYGYTYAVCEGYAGVDHSGEKNGQAGPDVTITAAGTYNTDSSTEVWRDGIFDQLYKQGLVTGVSVGGQGVDEGSAGNGGKVTLSNSGNVSLYGSAQGSFNGLILAGSYGGLGDPANDNNNSNGGQGGQGQTVTVTNSGNLLMYGSVPTPEQGLFGIKAEAVGGAGGDQNNPVLDEGEQVGGNGGNAGTVTVTNSGSINLGSSGSRLLTNETGAAIFANSAGGKGGDNNGNAGTGGTVQVTHQGEAYSYWQVADNSKVFAIYAQSIGGDGTASTDNSDNGGNGGGSSGSWVQKVTVDVYGSVLLDVAGAANGVAVEGAGVAARAVGGKGGMGPAKDHSGGNGGVSGAVAVNLYTGASVATRGDNLPGLAAQSLGGQGGDGSDSAALAGQGGGGGFGGSASEVSVSAAASTSVTTTGAYSTGVVAQSIGGGGGTGSDFVSVLGGQGGNGGNGGDAGAVAATTAGTISTGGDHAYGVLAQSIAGSGGAGGADTAELVSLGGDGAGGGAANQVTMSNAGSIATTGYNSHGMIGQSIGGGGGASGSATGLLSVGGSSAGSTGSAGGTVVIGNTGSITTAGNAAAGIIAQSIGGGGGSGGDGSGGDSIGVLGVGGGGSGGGAGGNVIIQDLGAIQTSGQFGAGVLAQSVGGGGGNGGDTFTASVGVSVAIGGSASGGGNGGSVCMSNQGGCDGTLTYSTSNIATHGNYAPGIIAQSIGGGGGTGGSVKNASVASFAALQLGGSGGGGGKAAEVKVGYSNLNISTGGAHSTGILAQSIGGGGGNGGVGSSNAYTHGGPTNVKLTLALGGTGGAGGTGGGMDVTLNPDFVIRTLGSGSRGIVAQSIGGGGGASQGGTMNVSGSAEDRPSARLQVGLGATGGSGATGGAINAILQGAIRTEGGDADGALLQSIGGGGGLGGSLGADASSYPILDRIGNHSDNKERLSDEGSTYEFGVDVGGAGGTGGHGGNVSVNFGGKIATGGDWADGLVAQSIGGGGGVGGSSSASGSKIKANAIIGVGGSGGAGGDGGNMSVLFDDDHANSISTAGYNAYGVLLQSIGGGGGQGGDGSDQAQGTITVGASFGGTGGVAGNGGGIVTANGQGWLNVMTSGDDAPALAMQSIGGGGGTGGAGNSSSKLQQYSHSMSVSVGGNGGLSGSGGAIDVTTGIAATTQGDRAYAVLAQSIGGGGGLGGAGDAGNLTGVSLGGRGGAAGDGAAVTLNLNAGSRIATSGAGSHALIAQSIGGGGGIAGDTSKGIQLGTAGWTPGSGQTGGSGSGGTVNVVANGTIATQGTNAFGVIAQSIGGGGGLGGSANGGFAGSTALAGGAGSGGAVTVTQAGSIVAAGAGATGIFAQSAGPQGSGQVAVTVNGSVIGGTGSNAYGVWIVGGNQNILTVGELGAITAGSGGSAVRYDGAVLQETGNVFFASEAAGAAFAVNNAGTILGNIECGRGAAGLACDVKNAKSGTLSDATLYQANIDNAGLVAIGRSGAFDRLTVSGDFNLRVGGTLQADVDFANLKSPRMVVRGDTRLDGQIDARPITLLPDYEVTVATLEGDIQGSPNAKDSPVIDYAARLDGRDLRMRAVQADFAAPSMQLGANQRSVAGHLQSGWNLGGNAAMAPLFAALDMASREGASTYSDRLSDLSPGVTVAPAAQMQASMARFTGAMMSCPAFQGGDALTGEQDCLWGQVSGINTNQDSDGGVSGFSFDGVTYQFGGQRQVKPGWFVGGSVAYQNMRISGDDGRVSGKGDSGYAGVVVKRETGPWTFSAALGGGYGQYDINRSIRIPGLQSTADSGLDVYGAGLRLRAARTFAAEQVYLKPYVDLDAFYTRMPGYRESRNDLHLDVDSSDQFVVALSPTLELGGKVSLKNGATMRPYMYGGVSFLSDDEYTVRARLQGAPAGAGSFDTSVPMDDVIGRIGAGLQVSNAAGIDFRLQYDGEFSSHIQSHRGTLKVMVPF